jgi:hypothetical protein
MYDRLQVRQLEHDRKKLKDELRQRLYGDEEEDEDATVSPSNRFFSLSCCDQDGDVYASPHFNWGYSILSEEVR